MGIGVKEDTEDEEDQRDNKYSVQDLTKLFPGLMPVSLGCDLRAGVGVGLGIGVKEDTEDEDEKDNKVLGAEPRQALPWSHAGGLGGAG